MLFLLQLTHATVSKDAPLVSNAVDLLLQNAPHDVARARLLAVSAKESGAWLKALPVSSLGLRMDDSTIRVAVGLGHCCVVHTLVSTVRWK